MGTLFLFVLHGATAAAEIHTITAIGEYRMGDNDTRTDAKRLALLDAKRTALEQAGTYIESITQVKDFDLTREEIRAYTAGIVEVTEQAIRIVLEGETTVVKADVTLKVNTEILNQQINALRENLTARSSLERLKQENEKLTKEIDVKTQQLSLARSKSEAGEIAQKRRNILDRTEAHELVLQALAILHSYKKPTSSGKQKTLDEMTRAKHLLERAIALDPSDPYSHCAIIRVLLKLGEQSGAERRARLALDLEPDNPNHSLLSGQCSRGSRRSGGRNIGIPHWGSIGSERCSGPYKARRIVYGRQKARSCYCRVQGVCAIES